MEVFEARAATVCARVQPQRQPVVGMGASPQRVFTNRPQIGNITLDSPLHDFARVLNPANENVRSEYSAENILLILPKKTPVLNYNEKNTEAARDSY